MNETPPDVEVQDPCVTVSAANLSRGPAPTARDLELMWQRCCQSFARYFAVRIGNDQHSVDDLMQRLWIRMTEHSHSCRDANPEPWMWQIARNLLGEHRRHNGAVRRLIADPALAREISNRLDREELPDALIIRREAQQQVLLALTALGSEDQELLVGCYFEFESRAQLATRLGISERAIEGRLYRARRKLRDELDRIDSLEDFR